MILNPGSGDYGDLFDGDRWVASLHQWHFREPVRWPFEVWMVEAMILGEGGTIPATLDDTICLVVLEGKPSPWNLYGNGIVQILAGGMCRVEGIDQIRNMYSDPVKLPSRTPDEPER